MAPNGGQPFIMPDGRPLGAFLDSDGQRAGTGAGRRRGAKGQGKQQRWERSFRSTGAHVFGGPTSEADQIELEAISKVGRERRRRWLNDKILRDMAGAMTAADMDSLYKPPPFGVPIGAPRPSALSATALPEIMPLWDLFRNIDMEKQHRVLVRWEQHVAEQRAGGGAAGSASSPALRALKAWAGTSRKARDALRRGSLEVVHALETRILREVLGVLPLDSLPPDEVMERSGGAGSDSSSSIGVEAAALPADAAAAAAQPGGISPRSGGQPAASPPPPQQQPRRRALELTLSDGFHRLLVHGIAQFHGLSSFSRDAGSVSSQKASPAPSGPGNDVTDASPPTADSRECTRESQPTAADGQRITIVRQQQQDAPPLPDDDLITVSDVLLVMDQAGSGQLTAAMLEVPPTPDSRAEPWAVAAAAAAALSS